MNGRRLLRGTLALVLTLAAISPVAADDQLADAKRLYFAAQYEDALAMLANLASAGSIDTDEYKVLCLLGLEREGEAERIIERMVLKNPLATLDMNGRSPKFTSTYQTVRRRMLVMIAQTMYGLARTSYDAGRFVVAHAQFQDLITLLEKDKGSSVPLNDLSMLADGFLKLTGRQLEAAAPAVPRPEVQLPVEEVQVAVEAPQELPQPVSAEGKPFAPWRPQIYSADDADVTPPAIVDQQMPAWVPSAQFASVIFNGRIELTIGENGLVTSVRIIDRTHPQYDTALVAAARRWQYSPAVRDGKAVRYRKTLEFTLRGR